MGMTWPDDSKIDCRPTHVYINEYIVIQQNSNEANATTTVTVTTLVSQARTATVTMSEWQAMTQPPITVIITLN